MSERKPYFVELTVTAVVMAEDAADAMVVAERNAYEIVSDSPPSAGFGVLITRLDQLTDGWDGKCLPYGGDGNTRLEQILKQ